MILTVLGFFGRPDMNIDIGIMITSDAVEEVSAEALDGNMAAVVQDAWNGGSGISRIYTEEDTDENMFAYAVPVYADKEVAGALAAEVGTDVFADVLQDRSVLHGSGYIHLISDSGKILVRSEERVIEEELDTIYDNDYIAQEEQENIKDALIKGESCFSEFTYNGETYQVLLAPLGVNGWYLFLRTDGAEYQRQHLSSDDKYSDHHGRCAVYHFDHYRIRIQNHIQEQPQSDKKPPGMIR